MNKKLRSEFTRRQKMIRDNFEVYYYNDSHFQSVSLHTHRYYEFYFPVKGSIEMEIDHQKTPLTDHDIVIVPPGIMHRALTDPTDNSYCRYVFWVSSPYYEKIIRDLPQENLISKKAKNDKQYIYHFTDSEYTLIRSKILRLMEEDRSDRFGKDVFLDICVKDLILTITRIIHEKEDNNPTMDTTLLQNILSYIEHHLEEDLSLQLLGNHFYVSKYYISHLFKDSFGISVHQYILKKRLERCAADITAGRIINDIYKDYGFCDYSAFFRAFKKQYQISPAEYRNRNKKASVHDIKG